MIQSFQMKIILGSKSPGRKRTLEKAGYKFDIMASEIDEKAIRSDDFEKLPLLIAKAKATALLEKIKVPAILITCDQIAVCNGELREKPESKNQAREYLRSYAKYPVHINTAVVVTNTINKVQASGIETRQVFFRPIPESVIEELINDGRIMHTAGGFTLEHPLLKPYIQKFEGDEDSIIGLPIKLTKKLISKVSKP